MEEVKELRLDDARRSSGKEILKKAIRDEELVKALIEWDRLREMRGRPADAVGILDEFGADDEMFKAASKKLEQYGKITWQYENFIKYTFCVTRRYWEL
jgi:hypothetical protein